MALTPEESLEQIADLLKNTQALSPEKVKALEAAYKSLENEIKQSASKAKSLAGMLDETRRAGNVGISVNKKLNREIEENVKAIRRNSATTEEANDRIEKYKKSLEKEINNLDLQKSVLKHVDNTNKLAAAQEGLLSIVRAVAPTFAQLSKAGGQVLNAYQNPGSQIAGAAAVLEGAVSAAGTAAQGIGSGIASVGKGLMGIPGPAGLVGIALNVLGTGLGMAGQVAQEIASKVLPFLSRELENNIKAFQSISSSGAIFAGGLTDLIKTSGDAGLTLKQFDEIVKNNRESLAGLGESVASGSRRLSSVFKTGGEDFKKELLSMGFTIEEQGGLVAETMRSMRQSGAALTATNPEILAQTKKYADNLRIVSDITGEDAKKKMEEIKRTNSRLAMQQELAKLEPEQRAAFERAQANMSGLQRDALAQMIALKGAIADPELAAAVEQSPALKESLNLMYQKFQEGALDDTVARDIQKTYGDQVKSQLLGAEGVAMAGMAGVGGIIGGIEKRLGEELEFRNRYTPQAAQQAEDDLARSKNEAKQRESQTGAMTEAIMAQQRLNVEIMNKILESDVMGAYARAVANATNALLDMIDKFTGTSRNRPAAPTAAQQLGVATPGNVARRLQGPAQEAQQFGPMPEGPARLNAQQQKEWLALPAETKRQFQNNPAEWLKSQQPTQPVAPTAPPAPAAPAASQAVTPTAPTAPAAPAAPAPAAPVEQPRQRGFFENLFRSSENTDNSAQIKQAQTVIERQQTATGARKGNLSAALAEAMPVEKTQPVTPKLDLSDETLAKMNPTSPELAAVVEANQQLLAAISQQETKPDPVKTELTAKLAQQNELMSEMIDIMRDVSAHTKNTAEAVG